MFVLGASISNDFPSTAGAYDPTWNGWEDLTVSKFDPTGSNLIASTFVGGTNSDGLVGVNIFDTGDRADLALDDQGDVYVAATTNALDFPTTPGAYQPNSNPGLDGCAFKLSSDLSTLMWSTYLGGSANDLAYGLSIDAQRNVYVCGGTFSADFPTTAGAYQTAHQGNWDGFVSRIRNDGGALLNSTLLGTDTYDQAVMIDLDLSGNVYTTGQTMSNFFPITANTFSTQKGKNFFMKFNPSLSNLEASAAIGSDREYPDVTPTAFNIDSCGRIFFAGWAARIRFWLKWMPITPNAIQSETDHRNLYLLALSENFEDQYFGSFFGGKKSHEHSPCQDRSLRRPGHPVPQHLHRLSPW